MFSNYHFPSTSNRSIDFSSSHDEFEKNSQWTHTHIPPRVGAVFWKWSTQNQVDLAAGYDAGLRMGSTSRRTTPEYGSRSSPYAIRLFCTQINVRDGSTPTLCIWERWCSAIFRIGMQGHEVGKNAQVDNWLFVYLISRPVELAVPSPALQGKRPSGLSANLMYLLHIHVTILRMCM